MKLASVDGVTPHANDWHVALLRESGPVHPPRSIRLYCTAAASITANSLTPLAMATQTLTLGARH